MTQDQPQTPEPNQPQPPEPPTDAEKQTDAPPTDATLTEAALTEAALTEVELTDATLADAILGDVPPEERQLQSTDSPLASTASLEVAATEEPPGEPPAPPPAPPSPSPVAEPSPASASQSPSPSKVGTVIRLAGQLWGIVLPMLIIAGRWAWQVSLVTLKWIREAWKVLLPKIRTLLPEGWRKLPDWVLTTVAVSLLVFVLWLTAQLFSGSKPATAIDRTPPPLTAPAPASPTELVPDPEQIANIQTQVAEVTDQYAEGLIRAVQANFQADLLTVQLGNSWFNLDTASQTQLANELLKRSHKLKFHSLELTDTEGELLARSPVVGSKMVVYKKDEG